MYCAIAVKTRSLMEARAVNGPADTVTDDVLRCRMSATVITARIDIKLKNQIPDSESNSIG